MWFSLLSALWRSGSGQRPAGRKPASTRLRVEALEDRTVPCFLALANYDAGPSTPLVGDVNNDGKADIITAAAGTNYNLVSVLLGNGDGTFQNAINSTTGTPGVVVRLDGIADVNHDGNLDVLSVTTDYTFRVLLGNGDGTFHQGADYALPNSQRADSLAVGDVNNDGNTDVVVSGTADGRVIKGAAYGGGDLTLHNSYVNVLLGNAGGSFQLKSTVVLVKNSLLNAAIGVPVAIGDFTSDARLDVLVATTSPYNSKDPNALSVSLLAGKGDGTLARPKVVANGGIGGFIIPADSNGDGRLDFVTGYYVYLGNGDGTFQWSYTATVPGSGPAVADFNRDGKLDLVYLYSSVANVYLGKGDGTFQPAQCALGVLTNDALAVGDFNGDGFPDLVVKLYSYTGQSQVSVLLNDGSW